MSKLKGGEREISTLGQTLVAYIRRAIYPKVIDRSESGRRL